MKRPWQESNKASIDAIRHPKYTDGSFFVSCI
jgi:hypothetical protein